jgi:ribosomal protein L12E/L44/L45/RPP1/RPP2
MKVNISGVGLIPKVGLLAPVYGRDLTKDKIEVILGYKAFKVYVAASGVEITKKNIDELFGTAVKQAASPAPAPAPKKEKKTTKKAL